VQADTRKTILQLVVVGAMQAMQSAYNNPDSGGSLSSGGGSGGGDDDPNWIKKMMDHARSKEARTISVPSEDGDADADGDNEEGWYEKNGKIYYTRYPGDWTNTNRSGAWYIYIYVTLYVYMFLPPPTHPCPPPI